MNPFLNTSLKLVHLFGQTLIEIILICFPRESQKNASCLLFFFSSLAWFKISFTNVFGKSMLLIHRLVCVGGGGQWSKLLCCSKKKKKNRKKHAEYLRHCICITPVKLNSYTFSSHFNKIPNNKKKQIPQAQGACKNVVLLKLTEQIVNICTVQVNEFPFIATFTLYNVLLLHWSTTN